MTNAPKYSPTWELDSLFPHPQTEPFQKILAAYRQELQRLAEWSSRLPQVNGRSEHVAEWADFLAAYQPVLARREDLDSFIECHSAADADNLLFRQIAGQLSALEPLAEQTSTNLEFALKEASDEQWRAFVEADPRLAEVEFFLRDRRRHAELRLPKPQELLAAELDVDGLHAWSRLYDRVSGALRVRVMERGEILEKSVGQIHFESPQRAVRENHFYAANRAWNSIADICAAALNHISGTRLTRYRRLGLKDHLQVPCRLNRMRCETLDTMWAVVGERKACLSDYLHQKAAALGLDRLAWYDVSAPYPSGAAASEIPYDDACELVIRALHGYTAELGQFARRAIHERWVEAENRPGKRQGGFCAGFAERGQSRIFMTFTNSPDGVSTLAHELGHAYHSHVLHERPLLLRQYPMNLAETASTFAEAVLGEQRLRESESAAEQLGILDVMLADAVSFLMNIHARFLFEDAFYRQRAEGELSAAQLSDLMLAAQKQAYLDALADDGWNPSFWISKLHFYISKWPFYNFPYTFGYLLSLGLYALGAEDRASFPERYRQLLIATGCQDTEDAVRSTFGYELSGPEFWHKCLDVVQQRVERFVELAGSAG